MLKKIFPFLLLSSNLLFANNIKLYEKELKKLLIEVERSELVNSGETKRPITIVNFWASWCNPCIKEFKSLNTLIEKYGKKIFVLGVNNDDEKPKKKIKKIQKKYKLKFKSVLAEKYNLADRFHVSRIPTSFIFVDGKYVKHIVKEFDFMSSDFISNLKKKVKDL